ncbi:MAG: glycosyltransferase family 4 protein [archaeon YNP-WB-062]|nr:glycosyltransferase family 4 protein [Candidatus Culexarchaeum yellowstonense]
MEIDRTLAYVRPFGRHTLGISVNEKYSPFEKVKYIGADISPNDWSWLGLKRVELINVKAREFRFVRTFWAELIGLERHLRDVDFIDTAELYTPFSYQCAKVAKELKKPLVVSVIETIPKHISSRLPPWSLYTKYVMEHADLLVALSNKAKEYLLSIGAKEDKVRVLRQGVDLDRFHPSKNRPLRDAVRVLFVSSLSKRRGLIELLKATKMLCNNGERVELWLVGDGPLKSLAQSYAQKYPVKLLGHIHYRDLPEVYRQCDIFCLPGKDVYRFGIKVMEDGQYTIAVLEAMASGLPLVVSDSGAYPEIVGSDNFIVEQGNAKQLYESLKILVEDEKLRRRISASNRARAEKLFDGKKCCEAYAEELIKLV